MNEAIDPRYEGYAQWKGWLRGDRSHLADLHDAYARELRGISLAGARVHELGFGDGQFLDWARSRGAIVSGVELDPALVAAARAREHDARMVGADGSIGSLAPASVDVIVAFDVLEHLSKAQITRVLQEAAAALKPAGTFLARFPNAASPFSGLYQHGDATHETALTADLLTQLVGATPLRLLAARNAARPLTGGVSKRVVRGLRYAAQSAVGSFLSAAYFGRNVPLDPNTTVVFVKEGRAAPA